MCLKHAQSGQHGDERNMGITLLLLIVTNVVLICSNCANISWISSETVLRNKLKMDFLLFGNRNCGTPLQTIFTQLKPDIHGKNQTNKALS